jgi:hypothetical protein
VFGQPGRHGLSVMHAQVVQDGEDGADQPSQREELPLIAALDGRSRPHTDHGDRATS